MKVRLNLATTPLENNRGFSISAGIIGTAALALLAMLSTHTLEIWRANREYRAEVSRLEREISDLRRERTDLDKFFKQADTRQVMDRATLLNGLIQQRSFPWTQIFMDLERLLPAGMRVVNISPRMREGRVEVRLQLGALNDDLVQKFLETLDESKEFRDIQLLGTARPSRPGESDRVLVDLVAWYITETK